METFLGPEESCQVNQLFKLTKKREKESPSVLEDGDKCEICGNRCVVRVRACWRCLTCGWESCG